MALIKKLIFPVAFLMLLSCQKQPAERLAQWSFDRQEGDTLVEGISQTLFSIHSDVHAPEWVRGVNGRALRLDGYSTWVKGNLKEAKLDSTFSFSGWYALASYPVDTAAFMSWMNARNTRRWELGVDPFGWPLVILEHEGTRKVYRADQSLEKHTWLNLTMVVKDDLLQLWSNGHKALEKQISFNFAQESNAADIYMGRSRNAKKVVDLFPTTTINGILDEMILYQDALSGQEIADIYNSQKPEEKPYLDVPESRFAGDFYRPEYHPIPDAAWTNETHGLVYHNDAYHIFYQHNPNGPFWAHINWGHMSSPDMVSWNDHKPVLWPEPGYDSFGIWSGDVIHNDEGTPVVMYTGGDGEIYSMCLAEPLDDKLNEWKKYEGNPVVSGVPESFARKDMRDPYIWKEGDTYYMIIGFGLEKGDHRAGSLLFYKSDDLKDWTFIDTFYAGEPKMDDSGVFWEMPVFWKFEDKYVLLVNKVPHQGVPARALYWVGEFKNDRFIPDFQKPKPLEVVNGLLSPSVAKDAQGRTTAIAIIPDEISARGNYNLGWAHLYSIPRIWKLSNGQLHQYPHPNLKKLRDGYQQFQDLKLGGNSPDNLPRIEKRQVEIKARIIRKDAEKVGLFVGKSPNGKEYTEIAYDFNQQRFQVDRTHSSLNTNMHDDVKKGTYPLQGKTDTLDLHVFIDGSVVEVFLGDGAAFTTRMFPEQESSRLTEIFARGGEATIDHLEVWHLKPDGQSK
jgi:sucrose-6-phosphate hydrolase SacC (GH32 family)